MESVDRQPHAKVLRNGLIRACFGNENLLSDLRVMFVVYFVIPDIRIAQICREGQDKMCSLQFADDKNIRQDVRD